MPIPIFLMVVGHNGISIRTICKCHWLFFGSLILTFHSSFRSVRNFVIDVRRWNSIFLACNILHPKTVQFSYRAVFSRVPAQNSQGTGLHWQVSQATSLINIVVHMSTATNTAHQGIFMENGRWATEHPSIHEFDVIISGGFMGDLVFNGGQFQFFLNAQGKPDLEFRKIRHLGRKSTVGAFSWSKVDYSTYNGQDSQFVISPSTMLRRVFSRSGTGVSLLPMLIFFQM